MKHRVGEHAVGPRPGESWRGIHLLTGNNEQIDALTTKIPEVVEVGINVIIAEVNYDYAYPSHPELRGDNPITLDRARALAKVCREHAIRLVSQFQCLGHQSWRETTFPLLLQKGFRV